LALFGFDAQAASIACGGKVTVGGKSCENEGTPKQGEPGEEPAEDTMARLARA